MTQEEFKIVMTSEVDKALANMKTAEKMFDDFTATTNRATTALGGVGAAADKTSGKFVLLNKALLGSSNEMRAFITQAKLGEISFTKYGTSAGVAVKATQDLSKMAVNANGALMGFNNIIRDAPFGIIGIGNNIQQLNDSLVQMVKQTGSVKAAMTGLFGSIFSPAGILTVGLSAATTLWTLYSQRQQKAASEAKAAADAIHDVASAFLEGSQNAVKETAQLDNLYKAATNVTIPMATRINIVKELQKEYPSYFGNLSQEEILAGKATDAYNKLKDSLIAVARSKAIQDAVTKNQSELLELEQQRATLASQRLQLIARIQKAEDQIRQPQGSGGTGGAGAVGFAQIATSAQNSLDGLTKKVQENEAAQAALQKRNEELSAANEELIKTFGAAGAGIEDTTKKAGKHIKTIADVLKELNQEITAVNTKFAATGGTAQEIGKELQNAYEKALEALSKLGVSVDDNIFKNIKSEIERIQDYIKQPSFQREPVTIPIVAKPVFEIPRGDTTVLKGLNDSFDRVFNELNGRLIVSAKEIQDTLVNAFSNMGDAIGSALSSGGGFSNVILGFSNLISGILSKAGDEMIKLGVQMLAIKKAITFSFNNPALAIAAGIAAKAAASLIKSNAQASITASVPAFAQGGITNGPTLALVGDNPGGREAIVPSQDWREAFGGQRQEGGYIAEARFSRGDLLLLIKQALREEGRL